MQRVVIDISKIVLTDSYDGVELKDGEYVYDRVNDVMYIGFTGNEAHVCLYKLKARVNVSISKLRNVYANINADFIKPSINIINSMGDMRDITISVIGSYKPNALINTNVSNISKNISININADMIPPNANITVKGD